MNKIYTEEQYKQYSKFMEDSANTNDIIAGANIYIELKEWIKDNNISEESIDEMNKRMEDETEQLIEEDNPNLKCIFKTEQEKSLFLVLKGQYLNYNVIPNYEVSQLINLSKIKNLLTSEEYKFLTNEETCFNIAIFDLEGRVLKVYNIVREDSSKLTDEQKSTMLKLCKLINLNYEEV